ncbi:MAG: twin transmembrane helix small protein [Betaproteobacteria bacterium]|jgi:hypothetical protein|nr:twin transmembrane helix small protein [Betaproteobacteria bacterium]MBK7657233.1 twin transmembrane helix small protein [Betaproteobacteria bacterium]MBP6645437.1 twin transmembrane helix small protein [Burkholderiaceae bacterium]
MTTKLIILTFLALIVGSLFSALYLLFKRGEDTSKVARALTVRISLSMLLFVLLIAGFYFGIIPAQGNR